MRVSEPNMFPTRWGLTDMQAKSEKKRRQSTREEEKEASEGDSTEDVRKETPNRRTKKRKTSSIREHVVNKNLEVGSNGSSREEELESDMPSGFVHEVDNASDFVEEGNGDSKEKSHAKGKVKGPLTIKNIARFQEKQDRTGVVYISRVPPFMKPEKLRHLLSQHAEIGRIFLTPEDPALRSKRKAMGGNKRQNYVDGWVEFTNKRDAKLVAKALNSTPIGGRSTSFFSADMWTLKYLSGFKWKHLTEKIAYDNAARRQKLQAEIAQAKREKDFYLERVDQNKRLSKQKHGQKGENSTGTAEGVRDSGRMEVLRTFRQSRPIGSASPSTDDKPRQGANGGLLSKIFGK